MDHDLTWLPGLSRDIAAHPSAHTPERSKPAYSQSYLVNVQLQQPARNSLLNRVAQLLVWLLDRLCYLGAYSPSWVWERVMIMSPKSSYISARWKGHAEDVIFARYLILLESLTLATGPARELAGRIAYILSAHTYKPDDDRMAPVAAADNANATAHVTMWDEAFEPGLATMIVIFAANRAVLMPLLACAILLSPRFYNAFVSHLAAATFRAYTHGLNVSSSPEGKAKRLQHLLNRPVPRKAVKYYGIQEDKKISDLLLYMRADAAFTAAVHATMADQPTTEKGKPNREAGKKKREE